MEQEEGRERAGRLSGRVGEGMLHHAAKAVLETDPAQIGARNVPAWVESGRNATAYGWGDPSTPPPAVEPDESDPLGLGALTHSSELSAAQRDEIRRRALDRLAGRVGASAVDPHQPQAERVRAAQTAVQALAKATGEPESGDDDSGDTSWIATMLAAIEEPDVEQRRAKVAAALAGAEPISSDEPGTDGDPA